MARKRIGARYPILAPRVKRLSKKRRLQIKRSYLWKQKVNEIRESRGLGERQLDKMAERIEEVLAEQTRELTDIVEYYARIVQRAGVSGRDSLKVMNTMEKYLSSMKMHFTSPRTRKTLKLMSQKIAVMKKEALNHPNGVINPTAVRQFVELFSYFRAQLLGKKQATYNAYHRTISSILHKQVAELTAETIKKALSGALEPAPKPTTGWGNA